MIYKATITSQGFEETIENESMTQLHKALDDILQKMSIEYMPYQLGKLRKLQTYYKSFSPGDYKYMVAGKAIIKLSK